MSEAALQTPAAGLAADYEDLFRHAPCGYLIVSPDGRILQANETLARWIGSAAGSLAGRRFRDLLTLPGRIFYETNFAPMLRLEGALEEIALDLTTAGGEAAPMLASAMETRDARGGLVAIRVVLVRAKDRRGYERDLRTRETAAVQRLDDERQTAELREQFIAVLGHDLRNPLASIRAGVTLLSRRATEPRETMVAAMMHASVDRMAALIDNVLGHRLISSQPDAE